MRSVTASRSCCPAASERSAVIDGRFRFALHDLQRLQQCKVFCLFRARVLQLATDPGQFVRQRALALLQRDDVALCGGDAALALGDGNGRALRGFAQRGELGIEPLHVGGSLLRFALQRVGALFQRCQLFGELLQLALALEQPAAFARRAAGDGARGMHHFAFQRDDAVPPLRGVRFRQRQRGIQILRDDHAPEMMPGNRLIARFVADQIHRHAENARHRRHAGARRRGKQVQREEGGAARRASL